MAITIENIKKWTKMITGTSILHVTQDIGKQYSGTAVKGYYNNLTEKVLRDPRKNEVHLPKVSVEGKKDVVFAIAVFQYGLGAYDLFLQTRELLYYEQFIFCADWGIEHQCENGAWDAFSFITPSAPNSSMAQGEGASMLLRAYQETKKEIYYQAACKAIDFMLLPVEKGGTALYKGQQIQLKEFTDKPLVLNGMIFSFWGLYDLTKISTDVMLQQKCNQVLLTLTEILPHFDREYWSNYDIKDKIASPFYHAVHVAQLNVMYDLFRIEKFKEYADKWNVEQSKFINPKIAFCVKAYQKIVE